MRNWSVCLVIVTLLAAGCGLRESGVTTGQSTEELMQRWLALTQVETKEQLDITRASEIAGHLNAKGPEGLVPLLDVMAEKEDKPVTKLLAFICLLPYVNPQMTDRLLEMTSEEYPQTTRTCSTHLLGRIETDEVSARLRELAVDPNERVRATAKLVLIQRNDPDAVAGAYEFWTAAETTPKDREQLALVLPSTSLPERLDLVRLGVTDHAISFSARERLVVLLGQHGTPKDAAILREVATSDPDAGVRALAESAAAALAAAAEAPEEAEAPAAPEAEPAASEPPGAPIAGEPLPVEAVPGG